MLRVLVVRKFPSACEFCGTQFQSLKNNVQRWFRNIWWSLVEAKSSKNKIRKHAQSENSGKLLEAKAKQRVVDENLFNDKDLKDTFWQISIILFCDLCSVCGTFENGWIIVNVLDMNNDSRVVFFQVIWCCQTKFILISVKLIRAKERERERKKNLRFNLFFHLELT